MRISFVKSAVLAAALAASGFVTLSAQANNNFFDLSTGNFLQNWTNTGLITTDDNWSNVPSITGYLGDITPDTLTSADPQTLTSGTAGFTVDVIANQTSTAITAGGVAEFSGTEVGNNPVVAFQGSATADTPFLLLNINSLNRQNLTISYLLRDVDPVAKTTGSTQPVALQFRLGTTGDFTNIASAFVPDAALGGNTAVGVNLPNAFNNQSEIQFRILTRNATGSDQFIGVDDISVTSSAIAVNVPEAGTFALIAPVLGILGVMVARRRKLA